MRFAINCPRHGHEMLLTRRHVLGFMNGPIGPVLRWRCSCGQEGFLDRRGTHPDAAVATA